MVIESVRFVLIDIVCLFGFFCFLREVGCFGSGVLYFEGEFVVGNFCCKFRIVIVIVFVFGIVFFECIE